MVNYREHCGECGAYLATMTDQNLHADWHDSIAAQLNSLHHEVAALRAWFTPIGGQR